LEIGTLPLTLKSLRPELRRAVHAAQSKKAGGVTVINLAGLGAFTDAFLLCTGFSSRQVQAIADEIEQDLSRHGRQPRHREGYNTGEWVLLDYGFFVVHVFAERARLYYDLERLWRSAPRITLPDFDSAGAAGA
jgi:ribosome-associated protein